MASSHFTNTHKVGGVPTLYDSYIAGSRWNCAAASIAFVTFATWAAAEEAIGALHGMSLIEGQPNPLVVKLADGKVKQQVAAAVGFKHSVEAPLPSGQKRRFMGMVWPCASGSAA